MQRRYFISKRVQCKAVYAQPEQTQDWGIKLLRVPEVWKESQGEGVNVAILDTGCAQHTDLVGNLRGGVNFSGGSERDYTDRAGHGTHVAGIIAAMNNAIGVVGVAPKANLYSVKVLGDGGSGSLDAIAQGIDWAIDNGMDIISMSLGTSYDSDDIHDAVMRAYAKNVTVVAAAGNDGDEFADNDIDYPGKYPEVICVGSINKRKIRSYFSGDGSEIDIAAPGEEILSTYLNDSYAVLSGTSMATPFITGVVALIISKHRKCPDSKTPVDTPRRLRDHLIRTADDAGEIGRDNFYGYGIVNLKNL